MNIRPYRYPPALRDAIEKQVADMLQKGLIQPSSSSFSSPVLLVKKKDGSYRFCVDFRHLNALTMKSKFPVPVFDQLMDELASASWFSNFNLFYSSQGKSSKRRFRPILASLSSESWFLFDRSPGVISGCHERHFGSWAAQIHHCLL